MGRNLDEIIARVRDCEHARVKVAVADIDGVLRGKYMHRDKFLSAAEKGFGFCDVVMGWDMADACYDNVEMTGWHSGYPDAEARIAMSTYREIPWDDGVPFFLADLGDAQQCPRSLLRRVAERAQSMGYATMFGCEFEWFNFQETPESLADKKYVEPTPLTPGMFGYSILRSSYRQDFFSTLFDAMRAFDVPLEGLHTETGPGVYEAAISAADALEAGDRAVLFKTGVKEIAYRHGIIASFMARWNPQLPGCSGHVHQSLWDLDRTRNLFSEPGAPHGMSRLFRQYLAGVLHCLPHVLPMYAPTINSYKRLVEGYWAPTRVTWGIDNRTVALRVIPGDKALRVETRVSGSDVNPYLAIAATLASGLYGIERGLELDLEPVRGNGYAVESAVRLPGNLHDAATAMGQSDSVARQLFGDTFVDHFVATRLWEWRQYACAVTDWELRRYFEII